MTRRSRRSLRNSRRRTTFDSKSRECILIIPKRRQQTQKRSYSHSGAANIVSHPREIASTVRRVDDSRKLARQAKAERKAEEKAKREEETKRLKGEKRRQIEKQLTALKAEFGEDALAGLDLEGDWDEAKHEAAVQKLLAGDDDDVRAKLFLTR